MGSSGGPDNMTDVDTDDISDLLRDSDDEWEASEPRTQMVSDRCGSGQNAVTDRCESGQNDLVTASATDDTGSVVQKRTQKPPHTKTESNLDVTNTEGTNNNQGMGTNDNENPLGIKILETFHMEDSLFRCLPQNENVNFEFGPIRMSNKKVSVVRNQERKEVTVEDDKADGVMSIGRSVGKRKGKRKKQTRKNKGSTAKNLKKTQ